MDVTVTGACGALQERYPIVSTPSPLRRCHGGSRAQRAAVATAACGAALVLVVSCAVRPPGDPAGSEAAQGTLAPAATPPSDLRDPERASDLPAPGSTIAPVSGEEVDLPPGLDLVVVALVTDDTGTDAAVVAVHELGAELDATVTVLTEEPGVPVSPDALLSDAVDEAADVVVVLGSELLGGVDRVSASTLDQQFVIVGAQLPEPTENVTAVIWPGAESRMDGVSADIAPRTSEALRAGLAAVDAGTTGYVVALP